jgi:hypothetical protein
MFSHLDYQIPEFNTDNTTEIKAMSHHLQQVPQAVMLECRLETSSTYSSSEKPTRLNMYPQSGQYNNVLANDTCLVDVEKRLYYMTFGWWISKASLQKANFIL